MEKVICLDINSDLLYTLDSHVLKMKNEKPRQHYSRKKVIEEALREYFKSNFGTIIKDNGLLINAFKKVRT